MTTSSSMMIWMKPLLSLPWWPGERWLANRAMALGPFQARSHWLLTRNLKQQQRAHLDSPLQHL